MDGETGDNGKVLVQSDVAVQDAGAEGKEIDIDGDDAEEEGKDDVAASDFHAPACDE